MPEFLYDSPAPPSEAVSVKEILGVLGYHKRMIALLTAVCVMAAGFLAFTESRVYRAQAVIRLSDVRPILMNEREVPEIGLSRATDPLLSRIEVLRSRTLIGNIVDSLGLRLIAIGSEPFTTQVSLVLPDGITLADLQEDKSRFRISTRMAALSLIVSLPGTSGSGPTAARSPWRRRPTMRDMAGSTAGSPATAIRATPGLTISTGSKPSRSVRLGAMASGCWKVSRSTAARIAAAENLVETQLQGLRGDLVECAVDNALCN